MFSATVNEKVSELAIWLGIYLSAFRAGSERRARRAASESERHRALTTTLTVSLSPARNANTTRCGDGCHGQQEQQLRPITLISFSETSLK